MTEDGEQLETGSVISAGIVFEDNLLLLEPSSQKLSSSSLSSSTATRPSLEVMYFSPGILQFGDRNTAIQTPSTSIYSPISSFLLNSYSRAVTSLTNGSCISIRDGNTVISSPVVSRRRSLPNSGKYFVKMSMHFCLFFMLAIP